jgi:HSP20 family molecular chaperone IbpA
MVAMRLAGDGRLADVNIRADRCEYVIELDVSDFAESELSIEALGPRLTVRGEHTETGGERREPFRLHERLEESFRLPDDADDDLLEVVYDHGTLEIHAPRTRLEPRSLPIDHPHNLFSFNSNAEPC